MGGRGGGGGGGGGQVNQLILPEHIFPASYFPS